MNTYELLTLALVSGWLIGASVLAVMVFLVLMVVALGRATRNADKLEGLDTSSQSPLSLLDSPPHTGALPPVVLSEPTKAAPMPAVQMAAVVLPEPTPLVPVEVVQAVAKDASESLPTQAAPAIPPALSEHTQEGSLSAVEEETYITKENSIDPTLLTPETVIAQQIAQQIAERRAKLSSSEMLTANVRPEEEVKPGEVPSGFEPSPVSLPSAAAALPSPQTAPAKPGFTEQLPPTTRKLRPPTAAVAALSGSARLSLPNAQSPHLASAHVSSALPPTEPVFRPRASEIATLPTPVAPTPVRMMSSLGGHAGLSVDVATPSFLALDRKSDIPDIKEERRGALRFIFVTVIMAALVIVTFVPAVRGAMPSRVAGFLAGISYKLGVETPPPPPPPAKQIEVREYEIGYKPTSVKDVRTAVVGGVVKNISSAPLLNLKIEMQFFKRNSTTMPETRLIPLDTPNLAPGAEGHYVLEISDKDYWSSKFNRVLLQDGKEAVQVYNKWKLPSPVEPDPKAKNDKVTK